MQLSFLFTRAFRWWKMRTEAICKASPCLKPTRVFALKSVPDPWNRFCLLTNHSPQMTSVHTLLRWSTSISPLPLLVSWMTSQGRQHEMKHTFKNTLLRTHTHTHSLTKCQEQYPDLCSPPVCLLLMLLELKINGSLDTSCNSVIAHSGPVSYHMHYIRSCWIGCNGCRSFSLNSI